MKTELTKREKLSLLLLVHGLEDSPLALFELACPEQAAANKFPASAASRWLQSKRVSSFVEAQRAALRERRAKHDEEVVRAYVASVGIEETEAPGGKDYSNPANRKRLLNALIAGSNDSKEILDALKLIATQPETGEQARQEVQRFYMPLQCRDCPLYAEAKKKLENKHKNI